MSDIEIILKGFEKFINAHTTEQIQQAEADLKMLSNDINFGRLLHSILESPKVQNKYKKVVAVYTIRYARQTLLRKDQSKTNIVCQTLMRIIQNKNIQLEFRKHVGQALEAIIAADHNKIIRNAFHPNYIRLVNQATLLNDQNVNFQYLALFGQIIMNNPGFSQEVINFVKNSFVEVLKLASRVQKMVGKAIQQQNASLVYEKLWTLKLYSYLIRLYLRRFLLLDVITTKLLYADELQPFIRNGLNINIKNNEFNSSIFIVGSGKSVYILNRIKSDTICILHGIIKILHSSIKQVGLLTINATFSETANYLPIIIDATKRYITQYPMQQLPNQSTVKTLEEILSLISIIIKNNYYYQILFNYKTILIQEILFKILNLTADDIQNYILQPQEFFNSVIHIIQRQQKTTHKSTQIDKQEESEQIDSDTLRTLGGELMTQLCKYQDGTLSQIFKLSLMVLENQINTIYPRSLFLLIISLLRDLIKQREDILSKLYQIIYKKLQQPLSNTNIIDNMDYSMSMIVLSRYLMCFFKINEDKKVYSSAFQVVTKCINQIDQVPIIVSFEIIILLNQLAHNEEVGKNNSIEILTGLNKILPLNNKSLTLRTLQAILNLVKYNDEELAKNTTLVLETIFILVNIVDREMSTSQPNKVVINKCWNIIRQVGESQYLVPFLIPEIEKAIIPLLKYLDSKIMEVDFEEDVLLLVNSFIERSKRVSQNQLGIFEYVPKIFYERYHLVFGHCFPFINSLIFYGKDILVNAPIAIDYIIKMSQSSILTTKVGEKVLNEGQNCQGVLIMQSLILSCGDFLNVRWWSEMISILSNRLEMGPVSFDFFKANIIATMGLILVGAHGVFDSSLNQVIIKKILQSIVYFTQPYSSKVLVVAICQLLCSNAEFIMNKFTYLLDVAVTILQMSGSRKHKQFEDDIEEEQQKVYRNSLTMVMNSIKNIDQFHYFKKKVNWLKENCIERLQRSVSELPMSKKDFFKNVLAIERVMDEPRQILRVKRI